jgi:pentalenene oxygenase
MISTYRASGIDHGDVLSMLLTAADSDGSGGLSDEEIHDQVITLFLAGTETTAATLAWSLYLLGEHPPVAERVRAEVDATLSGRAAGWDDIPKLHLTQRVIIEALRLYPPVWIFTRVATRDTRLGAYSVRRGMTIAYSPYLLHRSPGVYDDPDSFDPDRWLPERSTADSRDAFVPFGAGARKCIGDVFGITEAVLALAAVAGQWTVDPVLDHPVQPAPRRPTLSPGRLPMWVRRRTLPTPAAEPTRGDRMPVDLQSREYPG